MKKYILSITAIFLIISSLSIIARTKTQKGKIIVNNIVELDKTIYDFGDVLLSQGPLSCTFNVKNISNKPIVIFNVVTSCGCTNVNWTRSPLKSGENGKITATYTNDEGPFPFDKTLTVYISNIPKPIILRLRGYSHKKKKGLNELYPINWNGLGFKNIDIKCGNMSQGSQKSDRIDIANLSSKPIKVIFDNVSKYLDISVNPNPIPAKSLAKITYTISSNRENWGKNYYYFTPIINGKKTNIVYNKIKYNKIGIWAYTKEDFKSWTHNQINNASEPIFAESTFTFTDIKEGNIINAIFKLSNKGKSPFIIYKIDSDWPNISYNKQISPLPAGKSENINIKIDTNKMPKGDNMITLTLTTNSPLRPIINLFIYGTIK